jgi:hypothetical protein
VCVPTSEPQPKHDISSKHKQTVKVTMAGRTIPSLSPWFLFFSFFSVLSFLLSLPLSGKMGLLPLSLGLLSTCPLLQGPVMVAVGVVPVVEETLGYTSPNRLEQQQRRARREEQRTPYCSETAKNQPTNTAGCAKGAKFQNRKQICRVLCLSLWSKIGEIWRFRCHFNLHIQGYPDPLRTLDLSGWFARFTFSNVDQNSYFGI